MHKTIIDIDASFDSLLATYIALKCKNINIECITSSFSWFDNENKAQKRGQQAAYLACAEIKSYAGCMKPLAKTLSYGRDFNVLQHRKETIIKNYNMKCGPCTLPAIEKTHAVTKIIEILRTAKEKVDFILLGPATNLACVLRIDSSLVDKIGEVYIRAGSYNASNCTCYAEQNAWSDPEALQIILHSSLNVTILPLDVCYKHPLSINLMDKIDISKSNFNELLFEGFNNAAADPYTNDIPLPNCMMITCIENPCIIKNTKAEYIDVNLSFDFGEGKTMFADTNLIDNFNAKVINEIDDIKFIDYIKYVLEI